METNCGVCDHARVNGSWPSDHKGTHCSGCHRSWTSAQEAHCTVCHEQFSSNSAADWHWKHIASVNQDTNEESSEDTHLSVSRLAMYGRGGKLTQREDRVWTTPMDAETREKFAQMRSKRLK